MRLALSNYLYAPDMDWKVKGRLKVINDDNEAVTLSAKDIRRLISEGSIISGIKYSFLDMKNLRSNNSAFYIEKPSGGSPICEDGKLEFFKNKVHYTMDLKEATKGGYLIVDTYGDGCIDLFYYNNDIGVLLLGKVHKGTIRVFSKYTVNFHSGYITENCNVLLVKGDNLDKSVKAMLTMYTLMGYKFDEVDGNLVLSKVPDNISSIVIPPFVKSVKERAFEGVKVATINVEYNSDTLEDVSYLFHHCECSVINIKNMNLSGFKEFNGLFSGCMNLKEVIGLDRIEHGVSFRGLFSECDSLTEVDLDLSHSRLKDCTRMFINCSSLKKVTLKLNLNKNTSLVGMFSDCISLKDLNLTYNGRCDNLERIYYNCRMLNDVDLRMQRTVNNSSVYEAISGCFGLKEARVIHGFDMGSCVPLREAQYWADAIDNNRFEFVEA